MNRLAKWWLSKTATQWDGKYDNGEIAFAVFTAIMAVCGVFVGGMFLLVLSIESHGILPLVLTLLGALVYGLFKVFQKAAND